MEIGPCHRMGGNQVMCVSLSPVSLLSLNGDGLDLVQGGFDWLVGQIIAEQYAAYLINVPCPPSTFLYPVHFLVCNAPSDISFSFLAIFLLNFNAGEKSRRKIVEYICSCGNILVVRRNIAV